MIGIFCLCGLFVWSGFNLTLMAWIGGIWAAVIAWRGLYKRAPVTAMIIASIFGVLLLGLLGGSCGSRPRLTGQSNETYCYSTKALTAGRQPA